MAGLRRHRPEGGDTGVTALKGGGDDNGVTALRTRRRTLRLVLDLLMGVGDLERARETFVPGLEGKSKGGLVANDDLADYVQRGAGAPAIQHRRKIGQRGDNVLPPPLAPG